jgi:hypothetical protein
MAITKLKHHNKCECQIVFGRSDYHCAHLECVDKKCTRKNKWIQWLSHATADELKSMGVPSVNIAEEWM